jgi:hypothetical protein
MPFKGTDVKAYSKAGKFPKIMRSSVYKIIKSYNKSPIGGLLESRNMPQKSLFKQDNRQLTYLKSKKESRIYEFPHPTSNFKGQLIISSPITNLAKKKVKELSRDVFIKLCEYILEKSIQISSRTIRILISFGKIVVQATNIYQEREKYEILFEVINGETSIGENNEELKVFIKMHVDLFTQICILSKDVAGSSLI